MTTEEVLAQIIGQRIVEIEQHPDWHEEYGWLSGFDGPVFVLENGVKIDARGEPMFLEFPE